MRCILIPIFIKTKDKNIDDQMYEYYNKVDTYSYKDYCTNCKSINDFSKHSTYERNCVFLNDSNSLSETTIIITVVKCNNCSKYHALIPSFLFPYHVYSSMTILFVLNKRKEEKELKLLKFLDSLNINYYTYFYWYNKSFIILTKSTTIIGNLIKNNNTISYIISFFDDFVTNYYKNFKLIFFSKLI
jgi:hypothetical protein